MSRMKDSQVVYQTDLFLFIYLFLHIVLYHVYLLTSSKATVLEEMPPFPERESSILAKLKKKKGSGTVSEVDESRKERSSANVNGNSDRATASTNAKVGFFFFVL